MKNTLKLLSLVLALLMVVAVFAACGDTSTETEKGTNASVETKKEEEVDPRQLVKDSVPEGYKAEGDFTFLVRSGNETEHELSCEELLNDVLYDAIHYRNIDVETRLGCKIVSIVQDCNNSDGSLTTWNNTLSTSVLTNTGDYDGAGIYASQSSPLAKDNIFLNMLNVSTDYGEGFVGLDKPWWNQTLVSELAVYDFLPFLAGDLLITNTSRGYCIFFNKDMFNERFPDENANGLYASVKDGSWTIQKLIDYVDQVWDDTNSDGIPNDGDVLGWHANASNSDGGQDAWLWALGLNITQMDAYGEPELALVTNPNTVPAYELVKKLYTGTQGSFNGAGSETSLKNLNQLFAKGYLSTGESFRDSELNYGVLPLPKFDEDQEDYRDIFCNNSTFLVLCSNLSEDRAKEVSAVIEVLAAESYKQVIPAYYGKVLQGIYSKDQPDAEMYDLIVKSFVSDFGYAYSTKSIGQIGSIFRDVSDSFSIANKIDSSKTSWETALKQLLTALEAVA